MRSWMVAAVSLARVQINGCVMPLGQAESGTNCVHQWCQLIYALSVCHHTLYTLIAADRYQLIISWYRL
jgi:hypothetical protein